VADSRKRWDDRKGRVISSTTTSFAARVCLGVGCEAAWMEATEGLAVVRAYRHIAERTYHPTPQPQPCNVNHHINCTFLSQKLACVKSQSGLLIVFNPCTVKPTRRHLLRLQHEFSQQDLGTL
jgi:hypothetical protein